MLDISAVGGAIGILSSDWAAWIWLIPGLLIGLVFGAIVVKIVAVRSRRSPGWFLPLAGGLLFTLLVAVVLTSAVWYISAKGWPLAGG